jgi:hypothetical protein
MQKSFKYSESDLEVFSYIQFQCFIYLYLNYNMFILNLDNTSFYTVIPFLSKYIDYIIICLIYLIYIILL